MGTLHAGAMPRCERDASRSAPASRQLITVAILAPGARTPPAPHRIAPSLTDNNCRRIYVASLARTYWDRGFVNALSLVCIAGSNYILH